MGSKKVKTYQYRQIKININTEESDNIKLLSVLDGFNAWERKHMIPGCFS